MCVCVEAGDTFRDLANFGLGQEGDEARAVTDGEIWEKTEMTHM